MLFGVGRTGRGPSLEKEAWRTEGRQGSSPFAALRLVAQRTRVQPALDKDGRGCRQPSYQSLHWLS